MDNLKNEIKSLLTRAILIGAIGAAVVFFYSLFAEKSWLVTGRVVVFPSGSPASASQNLFLEVGNAAWIANSDTFQKRYFADLGANFSGAEIVKNSSMILIKFQSSEENIQNIEDLIIKIPSQISEYSRDLYEGSPFRYKMAGDPEISGSPVRPNMVKNVSWGFFGGLILFLMYWIFFELLRVKKEETEEDWKISIPKSISTFASPKIEEVSMAPEEESEPSEPAKQEILPRPAEIAKKGSAPSNLPIAEVEEIAESAMPLQEKLREEKTEDPTDEEIKERLNRLMRGEL